MNSVVQKSNSEPLKQNGETMRYRKFGGTGLEVSALSFGCMRLIDDVPLNTELISTVCSGMSTFEMLRQNAKTVFDFDPANSKSHEEMCEGLDKLIKATGGQLCTNCRYCMPCPQNVNIPHFMNIQKNIYG